MLTDNQRQIFSKMLDINWNAVQEKDFTKKFKLYEDLAVLEKQLKQSMGEEEFNKFISRGKQMFAAA
jgi:hypothetical protein